MGKIVVFNTAEKAVRVALEWAAKENKSVFSCTDNHTRGRSWAEFDLTGFNATCFAHGEGRHDGRFATYYVVADKCPSARDNHGDDAFVYKHHDECYDGKDVPFMCCQANY